MSREEEEDTFWQNHIEETLRKYGTDHSGQAISDTAYSPPGPYDRPQGFQHGISAQTQYSDPSAGAAHPQNRHQDNTTESPWNLQGYGAGTQVPSLPAIQLGDGLPVDSFQPSFGGSDPDSYPTNGSEFYYAASPSDTMLHSPGSVYQVSSLSSPSVPRLDTTYRPDAEWSYGATPTSDDLHYNQHPWEVEVETQPGSGYLHPSSAGYNTVDQTGSDEASNDGYVGSEQGASDNSQADPRPIKRNRRGKKGVPMNELLTKLETLNAKRMALENRTLGLPPSDSSRSRQHGEPPDLNNRALIRGRIGYAKQRIQKLKQELSLPSDEKTGSRTTGQSLSSVEETPEYLKAKDDHRGLLHELETKKQKTRTLETKLRLPDSVDKSSRFGQSLTDSPTLGTLRNRLYKARRKRKRQDEINACLEEFPDLP